jgi:hypothetical protein
LTLNAAGEPLLATSVELQRLPTLRRPREGAEKAAYERYLLNCSDYLKRQMMIYEHWPQRKYDVLGYRNEKVFTDMNA